MKTLFKFDNKILVAKSIIYRILQTLALASLATLAQANTLTASVDRNNVALQETLTLIVTADDQTKDTPDFSALKNDFDVLSTSRSSSIRMINGTTESSTDWHITLAPKRAGTLLIPSFNVDNAVSDAIEITVAQQSQTQTDSNEQVYVTFEASKKSVFVQEQMLAKIKLITEVNLSQAEMQPLELKNALVVNLDQQQYQTTINGKPHLVVETSFAIFPQESGELIIPSLGYNVAIDNSRNGWGDPFGRSRNKVLRLRTEEQRITVSPVPDQMANRNWQPANQLTLSENWSSGVANLKVGEPVTRTITITADGLTGGQIAPIDSRNTDGLTFYPDQAQTKDNKSAQGVQGLRVETVAIVPNRSGDFILPAINVDWWDNNTQTLKTASLPEKTIHVDGDALTLQPPQIQNASAANSVTNTITAPLPSIQPSNGGSPWLWASSIFFALLSVALTVYSLQLKMRLKKLHAEQEAEYTKLSETESNMWDILKHAAASEDATAFRKAVLKWAKFHWPTQQIHTLDDIAKLAMNEKLTLALQQLDTLLYSNHATTEWDAKGILTLLREYKKEKKNRSAPDDLKPLYASQ